MCRIQGALHRTFGEEDFPAPRYSPSLETVAQACRSRIIIAENREALAAYIANKLSGQVISTKGSVFGDNHESIQASFADYG